ncbi:MAG: hypothetical protein JSS81_01055 [Acidobacteria bacterium]|nr:hypothetical protein [Acidobacteriota bacterium]
MNPTFEKQFALTDQFCLDYFARHADGIFRIEFREPFRPAADTEAAVESFYRTGFVSGFNDSFGDIYRKFTHQPFELAEAKLFFETLVPAVIRRFFESGLRLDEFETVQTGLNGRELFLRSSLLGIGEDGLLRCVWGTVRDVTAEKAARQTAEEVEKNLRQTQKIEALGRLAGGIAHDFNNFLAVMVLHNDMLNLQLPSASPLRHRIEEMRKAIGNATSLVRQLLAVGRKQTLHPRPTEINAAINEFAKILSSIVTDEIEVVFNLDPDSGVCFVDQKQLLQTLASLAANARDAMPAGGVLTIETSSVVLDKQSIGHKSQPEGSFVQVTIADNGVGMDPATLDGVFEPFFSKKQSSKGVGLGLATAYGFVKQSKGFIWVESELDKGTTFRIQFPRIDQPEMLDKPVFP